MGVKAHRKVYNVLYGDSHVAAYGDPQESIVWHMEGFGTKSSVNNLAAYGQLGQQYVLRHNNGANSGWSPYGKSVTDTCFVGTALAVWHGLDTANGIDLP